MSQMQPATSFCKYSFRETQPCSVYMQSVAALCDRGRVEYRTRDLTACKLRNIYSVAPYRKTL